MISYVTYDAQGFLTGAYLQQIHPEHLENHFIVSNEDRLNWLGFKMNEARNGLEVYIPEPVITPEPVPKAVTMRQARLALLNIGKLSDVATAIAGLPSPQKEAAEIEWEFSSTIERKRPLVQTLGPLLGLSEAQLDDLFITASKL